MVKETLARRLKRDLIEYLSDQLEEWMADEAVESAVKQQLRGARCLLAFEGALLSPVEPVICLVLKGQREPHHTFKIKSKRVFQLSTPRDAVERDVMIRGLGQLIKVLTEKQTKLEAS